MDILRRISPENRIRILRFCIVGVTGVAVNLLVTSGAKEFWFVDHDGLSALNLAAFLGTAVSIFSNFILNDYWTWGDRTKTPQTGWAYRLVKYYLTASAGGGIELGVFNLVVYFTSPDAYLWAKLVGIASATFTNFTLMHFWVFRGSEEVAEPQK